MFRSSVSPARSPFARRSAAALAFVLGSFNARSAHAQAQVMTTASGISCSVGSGVWLTQDADAALCAPTNAQAPSAFFSPFLATASSESSASATGGLLRVRSVGQASLMTADAMRPTPDFSANASAAARFQDQLAFTPLLGGAALPTIARLTFTVEGALQAAGNFTYSPRPNVSFDVGTARALQDFSACVLSTIGASVFCSTFSDPITGEWSVGRLSDGTSGSVVDFSYPASVTLSVPVSMIGGALLSSPFRFTMVASAGVGVGIPNVQWAGTIGGAATAAFENTAKVTGLALLAADQSDVTASYAYTSTFGLVIASPTTTAPEPATIALLGTGLLGVLALRRRAVSRSGSRHGRTA